MSESKIAVGFDRYIEREWLDQTADWVVARQPYNDLSKNITDYLESYIQGERSKTLTRHLLVSIWSAKTPATQEYFHRACQLWPMANKQERLILHWGLAVANYPFFARLVRLIGRLNKLQGYVHSRELVRRSVELHSDTETVRRATTRLLQSLVQWRILDTQEVSVFSANQKIDIQNEELLSWLYAALFFSNGRQRLAVSEILADPVWFPFQYEATTSQVIKSGLLAIVHSDNSDSLAALNIM